jgi:prenylcysteine oxidase / farnesylcysteine lyase
MSVRGGNWQIFDNMVKRSGAAFYGNTTVAAISLDEKRGSSDNEPKYIISTADSSSAVSSPSDFPVAFDNVVVAAPWQFSDITANRGVLGHLIDEIPYTKLHVTLFASPFKLHQDYFGLPPGAKSPSNVYTTLGKGEHAEKGPEGVGRAGFYSISTLRRVVNPRTQNLEYLYKIFSPHAVTSEFLTDILGVHVPRTFVRAADDDEGDAASTVVDPISWYHPAWFWSYPQELPRLTFQDPIIGNGLYYTSGIESFISTMETSALMGKNVARLIADDFAGIKRDNDMIDDFQRDKPKDKGASNEEL